MHIFRGLPADAATHPCALAIGNFDGVHRGHMALLEKTRQAAKRHGITSAVLTFTPHPRQFFALKAGRPADAPTTITPLRSKIRALSRSGVDRVILLRFNEKLAALSPEAFIDTILVKGLNVTWLIVGEAFHFGRNREGSAKDLVAAGKQYGFVTEIMPSVMEKGNRISSSAVRQALKHNDFAQVETLLGMPYYISGHVIHGDKRGHGMGFPTANLPMRHFNPILSGVYITRVHGLTEAPLPAVSVIGTRPTVDATPRIVLETHLLDYAKNCYGALIHVEFLKKLRDNRKFPGLDALTAAIGHDVETARAFFADPGNISRLSLKQQI
ncbi:MAG: bifunctional riboflavin kinase/FAD synthetase [Burkholderiaceae bacterium]|jgi:riboflavin kinase/FMN adenylyltransferase|nr:bifunctional riboflavin kinase/FAD synthetase [Burkholderiaceae bacterium]